MLRLPAFLLLVLMVSQTALADGMVYPRYRIHRGFYLPRERHVVEVVQPPWSGNFIINGARFTGISASCLSWAAGERITLVAGDWHGRCVTAVFYNFHRRSTCETWCR
jgi:hypothetical protein